jgi:hypothetical protein
MDGLIHEITASFPPQILSRFAECLLRYIDVTVAGQVKKMFKGGMGTGFNLIDHKTDERDQWHLPVPRECGGGFSRQFDKAS